jgi:hypothetical protein
MVDDPLEELLDYQEGEEVELESEKSDVEDTDDGGAIVTIEEEGTEYNENQEFYANLAEDIPDTSLKELATDLLDAIARDKEARKLRDKQYEEGIKRTGLGDDAPGGAQFQGASRVVHPILTEVCVDFAARTIKEIFPRTGASSGPVKDQIVGTPTAEKEEKAKRKTTYMNWQLTQQMPEFRNELEQLLTQVPLGGAQYLKLTWDKRLKRPRPYMVTIDDMYLPYAATSFYTAERKTHRQLVTQLEFDRRVLSGLYRDIELVAVSAPEQTKAAQANDKIEGREQNDYYDEDGLREIFEIYVECEIDEDKETKGDTAPYVVTVDAVSQEILAIYRNWDEDDTRRIALDWIIEWPFVPWRGAYPIGIVHMIGGLSAAITGSLRALMDSAHIQNSQTGLKLKGGSRGGQSLNIQPTQVIEVEGSPNNDDIRKTFMPLPFPGPSQTLFTLMGFLVDAAKGVVRTTFEDLSDNPDRLPVGTTLALIEQGMTVFNAIHARLHDSMGKTLKVLHRLNATYLDEQVVIDELGELIVKRSDFEGPMDVVPVSDPNIFSEIQRFAQLQLIEQRAQAMPQLYDLRKVEEMILDRTKIPNARDLLIKQPEPQRLNAVNENVAATMGAPIVAFPDQDHLSHIQVHLSYITNPLLGASQIMAPIVIPSMLNHVKDHLALWYVNETVRIASEAAGMDIAKLMDPDNPAVDQEFDRMLAAADLRVEQQAMQQLQAIPEIIKQATQVLQSFQAPPPMDPSQVAMQIQTAETQRRAQADQVKAQIDQAKIAATTQMKTAEIQSKEQINREDNQTAMLIAASEIEQGHRTNIKSGTSLMKGN